MTNFFYFDQNNQKCGPVSEEQLKVLASFGLITPQTPMETDTGDKGVAGQIPGINFGTAAPSPCAQPTPKQQFDNYTPPPVGQVSIPPSQTGGGTAITSLICGIGSVITGGGLLLLPLIGLIFGILGMKSKKSGIATAGVCLNAIGLLYLMVVLLLPAIAGAREAAGRMQCSNKMHQIVIALHNYHDEHLTAFPPLHSVDKTGKPLHSWRVILLPFFGENDLNDLYKQIRLEEPWDSEYNSQFHDRIIDAYCCPSNKRIKGKANCTYSLIKDNRYGFPEGGKTIGFHSITDGTSNTIAVIEVKKPFCWMDPNADVMLDDLAKGINVSDEHVGSFHPGGCNMCLIDSSVKFVSDTIAPEVLRAIGTRNGNEVFSDGKLVSGDGH
jgi:hypothetical protein